MRQDVATDEDLEGDAKATLLRDPEPVLPGYRTGTFAGKAVREAAALRRTATVVPGDPLNEMDRRKADQIEAEALERLPEGWAQKGAGNELVPVVDRFCLKNTVSDPTYVTAAASHARLDLALEARSLETGLDMAETIEATNSAEAALAHQLAATHTATMRMMAQVQTQLDRLSTTAFDNRTAQTLATVNIETCRLANAAARMQQAYQQGLLTLQRLRTGGTQSIHVVHQQVQVQEGGQAVIAGKNVRGKAKRGKGRKNV